MENTTEKKDTIVDKIWSVFASIKLAAITFGLIALSSIIGTVLEQTPDPTKNLQLLGKMFSPALAPTLYGIFDALGFFDMYHSWWFTTFLMVFSINIVICSIDRLPNILKVMNQPLNPLPLEKFGAYPIKREIRAGTDPDAAREKLRVALRKAGFRANEATESGATQFFGQKGAFSRLGVYVTHLSILVIFAGAVIGLYFGFNGYLNLPEGFTSDVAYSRKGGESHFLGFTIKCDDFDVDYYRDSDRPQDYKSWLTLTKDGKVVRQKVIEVNHPIKHEGYTFYQSSYGLMPEGRGIRELVFNVTGTTGKSTVVRTEPGGSFTIPGTEIVGTIDDYSPALAFRQDGSTYTYNEMMTNPAVFIKFSNKGKELYSGWILKRYPQTWNLPDGNRVALVDLWGAQYTGLQVRKDPGVWIVYLGCLIMSIGLYSAFFMSHRKIWVALVPEGKKGSRILIAATANKNRPSFERRIEQAFQHITKTS